ncbi:GNAT family N-acetyltransferase [Brucella pituitosa]|uniref:GNAT family N-acetyltransferase n=1 Tax=Brucella pituitosa TaxID=571256 RepID=UPI000C27EBD3|nr:GNAT family N-acetyltransferase [Brucella pituitosa]MCK4203417.1 GNAT family N-acetyltransferase [Brucella pituitosa]PJO46842.1 GNAT family N-acetyltransferase [Brucella pituitosa]PRA86086.1 GNAT family N-acetyltransferase [Ochrobactrum sp. MYb29]
MSDDERQTEQSFVLRIVEGIGDFSEDEWNRLAGTSRQGGNYNPFISRAFLNALEQSGSVSQHAGWLPRHLRLEDDKGYLIGAVPNYLKGHSQGEYVFDHGWADAFERAGGRYYPKFQASIPFTPATGPRLLHHAEFEPDAVQLALANGLRQLTDQTGASSAHVTFAPKNEIFALEEAGFLHRTDQQFHFINNSFSRYDDFLNELVSRKRKALKKERRDALSEGIEVDWLTGSDLTEAVCDDFFEFYIDTGSRKWGRPYLNRKFFSLIGETMADDILLVMARRGGRYIAGAINFIGSDTLYGRHWGCIEDHPYLHFEVCYHQAIDFAIDRKLRGVEAGAQGEHKLARGYIPVTTHSAHYIAHEGFRRAVSDYLEHERREVEQIHAALEEHTPFRHE